MLGATEVSDEASKLRKRDPGYLLHVLPDQSFLHPGAGEVVVVSQGPFDSGVDLSTGTSP